jgi:acylphosphatase
MSIQKNILVEGFVQGVSYRKQYFGGNGGED